MSDKHLINPQLLAMAYEATATGSPVKQAFIGAGDPTMSGEQQPVAGAGGGADPSGGAGGGVDTAAIAAQVMQQLQAQGVGGQAGGMGGGMGGGMVEPIKPKIDVNVELMQIKKMLAKICDALGVHIPAQDMTVNSQDLTQMAMQQSGQGGGAQQQSAIQPIQPIGAAAPGMGGGGAAGGAGGAGGKIAQDTGYYYEAPAEMMGNVSDRARALMSVRLRRAG